MVGEVTGPLEGKIKKSLTQFDFSHGIEQDRDIVDGNSPRPTGRSVLTPLTVGYCIDFTSYARGPSNPALRISGCASVLIHSVILQISGTEPDMLSSKKKVRPPLPRYLFLYDLHPSTRSLHPLTPMGTHDHR